MDNLLIPVAIIVFVVVIYLLTQSGQQSRRRSGPPPPSNWPANPPSVQAPNSNVSVPPQFRSGNGPTIIDGSTYLTQGRFHSTQTAQQGRVGENRVIAAIEQALNSEWYVFRNVVLPDHNGDLDVVLVGPGGTWVLEVKAYKGNYRVENGTWRKETSNGYWARDRFGPNAQVKDNAVRLHYYLEECGLKHGSYVNRAVVAADEAAPEVISSGTAVWTLDSLPGELAKLQLRKQHSRERVEQIAAALMQRASANMLVH